MTHVSESEARMSNYIDVNGILIPISATTHKRSLAPDTTVVVNKGTEETAKPVHSYALYAWTHKHDKNGQTVILIACDRKLEKSEWKLLASRLKARYNAHYSKFMRAFVVYNQDVPAFKKSGTALHRKAPAFWKGAKA